MVHKYLRMKQAVHTLTDTMGVLCRHCSGTNHGALQGLSNGIGSPMA